MVNLYLLLPESNPVNQWMQNNQSFQDEDTIVGFIQELKSLLDSFSIENFQGFYDSHNINNFLSDFRILEDYYPRPEFRLLQILLKQWEDWREEMIQENKTTFLIFGQQITNHTFCELAQTKLNIPAKKNIILNHYGHNLGEEFIINKFGREVTILSKSNSQEILDWFAAERVPQRNFHIIPKHGENRSEIRTIGNELISPLRCSKQEAQSLLNTAIGESTKELYNFDENHDNFIVFKFEGPTPENLYHGFHLPKDTQEISAKIKIRLIKD